MCYSSKIEFGSRKTSLQLMDHDSVSGREVAQPACRRERKELMNRFGFSCFSARDSSSSGNEGRGEFCLETGSYSLENLSIKEAVLTALSLNNTPFSLRSSVSGKAISAEEFSKLIGRFAEALLCPSSQTSLSPPFHKREASPFLVQMTAPNFTNLPQPRHQARPPPQQGGLHFNWPASQGSLPLPSSKQHRKLQKDINCISLNSSHENQEIPCRNSPPCSWTTAAASAALLAPAPKARLQPSRVPLDLKSLIRSRQIEVLPSQGAWVVRCETQEFALTESV